MRTAWVGLAVATVSVAAVGPNASGPPPGYTGGFGEPTCTACHADAPVNDPGGRLALEGLPAAYEPGRAYDLVIVLARPELRRAGFQLTVRFEREDLRGRQAGELAAVSPRTEVRRWPAEVQYGQHTAVGAAVDGDRARWRIRWTAPSSGAGPVVVHVAANASNDDDSELGDFIFTGEWRLEPHGTGP